MVVAGFPNVAVGNISAPIDFVDVYWKHVSIRSNRDIRVVSDKIDGTCLKNLRKVSDSIGDS